MKIIGIRPSSFTGNDGSQVTGVNIYMTYALDKGTGMGCERVFVTDAKIKNWYYAPNVGDEVKLSYNRYGKVDCMEQVVV